MDQFDITHLQGEKCRIFPYRRGYLQRDTLYHAWSAVESEHAERRIFHSQLVGDEPISTRGDLQHFCQYFADDQARPLLICQEHGDTSIAGLVWLEELVPDYKGMAGIFFRKKSFGAVAEEAGHIAIAYAMHVYALKYLWCRTTWRDTSAYAQRLGFKMICTLPSYYLIDGKERDLYVLRMTAEEYAHGRRRRG